MKRLLIAVCLLFVCLTAAAQSQPQPEPHIVPVLPFEPPQPQKPEAPRGPVAAKGEAKSAPSEVRSESTSISGAAGTVNFDAPGNPPDYATMGVLLMPKPAYPSVGAQINGNAFWQHFSVYAARTPDSTLVDNLFTVRGDGRVGVGTTTPGGQFTVLANQSGRDALNAQRTLSVVAGAAPAEDVTIRSFAIADVPSGVVNTGYLIGSRVHSYLQGAGRMTSMFGAHIEAGMLASGQTGTITNAYGAYVGVRTLGGTVENGYALYIGDVIANSQYALYSVGADDKSYIAGKLGIGVTAPTAALEVNGDVVIGQPLAPGTTNPPRRLTVNGEIWGATVVGAIYQDVAEWVPASEDMVPGTVVVLDPSTSNQVMPSHRAYDSMVAGVVSAQPGVLLGVAAPTKEQIATTGRVKVKVDANRGAIAIGDILVTSDRPGMAMKSQPIDVAGVAIHRPGTVIGKALEPLPGGEGEILVLLSLQ